jgi:hypothetical protein
LGLLQQATGGGGGVNGTPLAFISSFLLSHVSALT